jgi:hypothetical protein
MEMEKRIGLHTLWSLQEMELGVLMSQEFTSYVLGLLKYDVTLRLDI